MLVGVRPDTERTGRSLRTLFAHYVVTGSNDAVRDNFSVRSPRLGKRWRSHELFLGGEVVGRATSFAGVARLLGGHLSGLAALPLGCTRVPGRLVVRGEDAVVVGAAWAEPIVPDSDGFEELAVWRPLVAARHDKVRVAEYLPAIDWQRAGLAPPNETRPRDLNLKGLVLPSGPSGQPEVVKFWRGSQGNLDEWGLLLSRFEHEGRIRSTPVPGMTQAHIAALLD